MPVRLLKIPALRRTRASRDLPFAGTLISGTGQARSSANNGPKYRYFTLQKGPEIGRKRSVSPLTRRIIRVAWHALTKPKTRQEGIA
ncbi:hypothetical protein SAMN05421759_1028 [Roseivivax lentus]|uniref:Transposase n=1 Tax=Roseivivax lentus TaxID=633194 RepID=A0A1N7KRN2_9RHOB|nr:hypothetical protein [Roseivivax lentus]SIS64268.1 hypothetical protein SAMN05421759_1028 [Roseivivax lentus]